MKDHCTGGQFSHGWIINTCIGKFALMSISGTCLNGHKSSVFHVVKKSPKNLLCQEMATGRIAFVFLWQRWK